MILLKIRNFLKALWFHVAAGLPKSSQEEINYRYNICTSCELFDIQASMCNHCGCNLSKKKEFFNKLAWSDQKCPIGKWGAKEN